MDDKELIQTDLFRDVTIIRCKKCKTMFISHGKKWSDFYEDSPAKSTGEDNECPYCEKAPPMCAYEVMMRSYVGNVLVYICGCGKPYRPYWENGRPY